MNTNIWGDFQICISVTLTYWNMTKGIITKTKIIMEKIILNAINNAIKDYVENAKINYSPKKTKLKDENVHKIQQEKTQIEIVGDSVVNGDREG